ncbi:MAG: hypothetical protein GWQ05_10365 [Verrucomicrobiaceae bacterium]|nr:hypothetical protein [Verrucomicrobiaceae bacterium]
MNHIVVAGCSCLALLGTAVGEPNENAEARYQQVIDYVKKSAAEVTTNALSGVKPLADWNAVRAQKHREFLYMLGLDPMPVRTALEAKVTGTIHTPNYHIENVVFQSSPKLYVTGNLYIPHNATTPLPTILYVCGHSPHPLGAKYQYQDRAQWYAENGYACFIIDTLEFGEVAGIHHGLHNLNMWQWISAGYTPAGIEVWNAMRAIDYLETREEVDQTRIGITGISGGGAISWFSAAADDRIAVAVPVCGTFTYGSQAKNWLADGQCDCIYFNNTYQSDLSIMGALIAPRPLMTCSGIKDSIFPPDGYHEVHRQVKPLYDLHGVDGIRNIDDDVPHQDSPKLRQETRQWFNRWFMNDTTPVDRVPNPENKRHTAEELACLKTIPWDAANFSAHDHFVTRKELAEPTKKEELLAELHDKTFRWFPEQSIPFEPIPNGGHGGWMDRYGEYDDFQIHSEANVRIRVQIVRARNRTPNTPLLVYLKRPEDTLSAVDVDELLAVLGHSDVAMVNPRLTDHQIDHQEWTNIERTAVWSGRTIAAMQVWDVLRATKWLAEELKTESRPIVLFAKSEMAVPALYATLLAPEISQVIVRDLHTSHDQAPPLLNVLRFTDIPEVGAVMGSRLCFLGARPPGFSLASEARSLPTALFEKLSPR